MFNKNSNQNNRNQQNPFGDFNPNAYNAPPFNPYQAPQFFDPNQSNMYPAMHYERLTYEIKENRRRINNLAKRVSRIENYLRIKEINDQEPIEFPKEDFSF